jgi:hypothetical protein
MTKRRRGNRHTHFQVPSLAALALQVVRGNEGRHFPHNLRTGRHLGRTIPMDTTMSDPGSTQSGSKRSRSAADGAREAGQGREVTVPRNIPHLFNDAHTVRLTFAQNNTHVLNQDGTAVQQIFSPFSIYDPDVTGTGHQPLCRDLWASQYDYYTVLACEYQIKIYVADSSSTTWTAVTPHGQQVGCINATFMKSSNGNDFNSAAGTGLIYPGAEMKNTITEFLPPDSMATFKGTVTPGDFVLDMIEQDSDRTWTAVGSNPSSTRLIGYVLSTAQATALAGVTPDPFTTIFTQVILNYDVQFVQMNQALRATSS